MIGSLEISDFLIVSEESIALVGRLKEVLQVSVDLKLLLRQGFMFLLCPLVEIIL